MTLFFFFYFCANSTPTLMKTKKTFTTKGEEL